MEFTASRYHDICAGHRVVGHEGKCRNLHGHNYRIHFHCIPDRGDDVAGLDKVGRVVDFSIINSTLCAWVENNWDHKMLLWDRDPQLAALQDLDPTVVSVPFNPTAEQLAYYLVEVVAPNLLKDLGVTLRRVDIEETRKCTASYEIK